LNGRSLDGYSVSDPQCVPATAPPAFTHSTRSFTSSLASGLRVGS
jgi:hypothetical protein